VKVEVVPWSEDESAIAATRHTLDSLPNGPAVLMQEDGKWWLIAGDFIVRACKNQGYLKEIRS
jgi:hypothetical protein